MQKILSIILFFYLLSITLANSPYWLLEIDCDNNSNFFEIRTLNTYNISNCDNNDSYCGEYINLMYYSIFQKNILISDKCELLSRKLEYSLVPVNMTGSSYDSTPHFVLNLIVDDRSVINDLPLFPSPIYNKTLWGLKISSVRFNANAANIEIIVSDDELYEKTNPYKIKTFNQWLWDSNYISAFDPEWGSKWKPIVEDDIWNEKNFYTIE